MNLFFKLVRTPVLCPMENLDLYLKMVNDQSFISTSPVIF